MTSDLKSLAALLGRHAHDDLPRRFAVPLTDVIQHTSPGARQVSFEY
jgi:hypothetical protein